MQKRWLEPELGRRLSSPIQFSAGCWMSLEEGIAQGIDVSGWA